LFPPSNIAIGGFFIFDDSFSTRLLNHNKNSKSTIIDLLNDYRFNSQIQELRMNNFGWIDCGTTSGLNQLDSVLEILGARL
jgi:dTDP-glucose pyrophosphorylase